MSFGVAAILARQDQFEIWGQLVAITVVLNLLQQVAFWGHREPQLRAFAQTPSAVASLFGQWYTTRIVLLVPVLFWVLWSFNDPFGSPS